MSVTIIPKAQPDIPAAGSKTLRRIARKGILSALGCIRDGRVVLRDGEDVYSFGQPTERCNLSASIEVLDARFYGMAAFEGSIGAGEAYTLGYWQCSDLTALVRIFVVNREAMDAMDASLVSRLLQPIFRSAHRMRRNTRAGSAENIAAHYDLGNDLYALFLDRSMTYSAAIFDRPGMTLEEAQESKLDRICRKLDLRPQDHVLEIGTGWGSLAIHAAKNYGCRVTTTTISREQHDYAKQAIEEAGLSDRITLLLSDYRDLEGKYDKIVSIEMIEAVGWQFYGEFMRKCSDLLKDDGVAALQAITIRDQEYERARKSVDFIQRFIFPGSCIPSMTALLAAATKSSNLALFQLEDMTEHYATTLRTWRERFFARREDVRRLGFDDAFIRLWEYYLCYCEGGFLERNIGCVQMILTKPGARVAPILPSLR